MLYPLEKDSSYNVTGVFYLSRLSIIKKDIFH